MEIVSAPEDLSKEISLENAVKLNKEKIDNINIIIEQDEELVVKVGKRKFLRIVNWRTY